MSRRGHGVTHSVTRTGARTIALAAILSALGASTPSCVLELDRGIEVQLWARGVSDGTATIDSAWMRVGRVELVACEEDEDAVRAEAWRVLSTARAHHGDGLGPSLDEPQIVRLYASGHGSQSPFGLVHPPPGAYCAVRVRVERAADVLEGDAIDACPILAMGAREVRVCDDHTFEVPIVDATGQPAVLALETASDSGYLVVDVELEAAIAAAGTASEPADLFAALETTIVARIARE
ncbi:MAG: hypothetical protein AB7S26_33200 [Sandaracinaceae bacterium]